MSIWNVAGRPELEHAKKKGSEAAEAPRPTRRRHNVKRARVSSLGGKADACGMCRVLVDGLVGMAPAFCRREYPGVQGSGRLSTVASRMVVIWFIECAYVVAGRGM